MRACVCVCVGGGVVAARGHSLLHLLDQVVIVRTRPSTASLPLGSNIS